MHVLKKSVHSDYNKLHTDYSKLKGIITTQQEVISKLEASITIQQKDVSTVLTKKICESDHKIKTCLEDNKLLRKENKDLKERLTKIELAHLGNNVIISGMQEQRWESYSTTKDRVYNTIEAAMGGDDLAATLLEAKKIEIFCCNRIGPYQLNCS